MEGIVDPRPILCARFVVHETVVVRVLFCGFLCDRSFRTWDVDLVPNQKDWHVPLLPLRIFRDRNVLFQIVQPRIDRVEGLLAPNVVDQDNPALRRFLVVIPKQRTKAFLACRIPYLALYTDVIYLYRPTLTLPKRTS